MQGIQLEFFFNFAFILTDVQIMAMKWVAVLRVPRLGFALNFIQFSFLQNCVCVAVCQFPSDTPQGVCDCQIMAMNCVAV